MTRSSHNDSSSSFLPVQGTPGGTGFCFLSGWGKAQPFHQSILLLKGFCFQGGAWEERPEWICWAHGTTRIPRKRGKFCTTPFRPAEGWLGREAEAMVPKLGVLSPSWSTGTGAHQGHAKQIPPFCFVFLALQGNPGTPGPKGNKVSINLRGRSQVAEIPGWQWDSPLPSPGSLALTPSIHLISLSPSCPSSPRLLEHPPEKTAGSQGN